jgi:hypothetical protein
MNSLSWLLYFAGVVGGLSTLFALLAFAGIVIGTFACAIVAGHTEQTPPKKLLAIPIIGLVFAVLACLIPNEKTIMYIAASEYGEKVMNSKEVQDLKNPAMDLLKQWMKKESEKLNKSESK